MTALVMNQLPALRNDTIIARLETANTMLAEADTISKKKAVVDVAAAAEVYSHRQKLGEEAIAYAHSIKIEALRQMGAQLKATPRNSGKLRKGPVVPQGNHGEKQPTLADLGVDKKTSSMAQKLADLPEKDFEAVRDGHESIGKAISRAKPKKPKPAATEKEPKPLAHESAKATARIKELAARIVELEADLDDMTKRRDALKEIADQIDAFQNNKEFKAMEVLRLELRSVKQRRDELTAENRSQKQHIAFLEKKLKKCEGK